MKSTLAIFAMHATATLVAAKSPWCPRGYHEVTPDSTSEALWTVGCAPNSHRLRRSFLKNTLEERQHCLIHPSGPKIIGNKIDDVNLPGTCNPHDECCAEPCCWTQSQIDQLEADNLLAASICDDDPASFAGCSNLCGDTSQSHYCADVSMQCAQDNCSPVTSCGNQVDGTARLSGNTDILAGNCNTCNANTEAPDEAADCLASPGFYYDGTLNECPAGSQTENALGATASGATSCTQCSAGTYDDDSVSSTECKNAEAGYFVDAAGATAQAQCFAGSQTEDASGATASGATSCTPCSAGNYDDDSASSTVCIQCPAGTFQLDEGQISCNNAEADYYVDSAGADAQIPCPAGSQTEDAFGVVTASGATSCVTCSSKAGGLYYDDDDKSSTACLECTNVPTNVRALVSGKCVNCDEAECDEHLECAAAHEVHTRDVDLSDDSHHHAAVSAHNAAAQACDSEANAGQSEANAAASETNAAASETNAATSETNAATSEANAGTSETNAATSETNAATSETNAATSEANAATSEANAGQSEANAANSEGNAANSEANAGQSETNAAASETNAAASETNAANSEGNAAASEANAGQSEANAGQSEANAANSEGNAAQSESATEVHKQETEVHKQETEVHKNETEVHKNDAQDAAARAEAEALRAESEAEDAEEHAQTAMMFSIIVLAAVFVAGVGYVVKSVRKARKEDEEEAKQQLLGRDRDAEFQTYAKIKF